MPGLLEFSSIISTPSGTLKSNSPAFNLARGAIPADDKSALAQGIQMVHRMFGQTFQRIGLVPFAGLSGRFGPDTTQIRDYNYGGGAEAKIECTLNLGGWVNVAFIGYYWWFRTFVGTAGNSYIGLIKPAITFRIIDKLNIGFEQLVYYSDRYPRDFPTVHSVRTEQKIFLQLFIEEFKFKGHVNLQKFSQYEIKKTRAVTVMPPHVPLMKRLEIADYEPGSDPGNIRWYPKGRMIKSLLEQYVTNRVAAYGGMEVETPIMYDFNHPSLKSYLNRFPAAVEACRQAGIGTTVEARWPRPKS